AAHDQAGRAVAIQGELGRGAAGGAPEEDAGGAVGQDAQVALVRTGGVVEDETGGAVRGDAERAAEMARSIAQVEALGVDRLRGPGDDGRLTEEACAPEQEKAEGHPAAPAPVVPFQLLDPPGERLHRGLRHGHLPALQLGGIFTVRTSDQPSWRSCFSTSGRLRRSPPRRSMAMATSRWRRGFRRRAVMSSTFLSLAISCSRCWYTRSWSAATIKSTCGAGPPFLTMRAV